MRFLGTFLAPAVASLPATGTAGQLVTLSSTGVLYAWSAGAWTAVGGGGGAQPSGTAVVDFGAAGNTTASVAVALSSITSTAAPTASVLLSPSADHSADEHFVEELVVYAGAVVAGAGFTIFARTRNFPLRGKFNVKWSLN